MIIDTAPAQYNLPMITIKKMAIEKNLPASLIAAIIVVESSGKKWASRYQPDYRYVYKVDEIAKLQGVTFQTELVHQRTSVGLMQIMFATARYMGYRGPYGHFYDPEINIRYGSEYLKTLFARHENLLDVISAYNAGQPFLDASRKRYVNQEYVDKIIKIKNEMEPWF